MKFRSGTIYHQKKCMHLKLTCLLQMRTRCLTGFWGWRGSENGGEGGNKKAGGGVGEDVLLDDADFCWISSIFIAADLCLLTISLQLENEKYQGLISQLELTEQNPPHGLWETGLSLLCHYELRQCNSGKALVCKEEGKKSSTFWWKRAKSHFPSLWLVPGMPRLGFCASEASDIPLQTCSVAVPQDPSVMCLQLVQK